MALPSAWKAITWRSGQARPPLVHPPPRACGRSPGLIRKKEPMPSRRLSQADHQGQPVGGKAQDKGQSQHQGK